MGVLRRDDERGVTSPNGELGAEGKLGEGRPSDWGRPSLRFGKEIDSERLCECLFLVGDVGRDLGADKLSRGGNAARSSVGKAGAFVRRRLGGRLPGDEGKVGEEMEICAEWWWWCSRIGRAGRRGIRGAAPGAAFAPNEKADRRAMATVSLSLSPPPMSGASASSLSMGVVTISRLAGARSSL